MSWLAYRPRNSFQLIQAPIVIPTPSPSFPPRPIIPSVTRHSREGGNPDQSFSLQPQNWMPAGPALVWF